jgi:hypothetical protein
VLLAG